MDWNIIIGQLGASGIFAGAIVVMAKLIYEHYEAEIRYLRAKVDALEKCVIDLQGQIKQAK